MGYMNTNLIVKPLTSWSQGLNQLGNNAKILTIKETIRKACFYLKTTLSYKKIINHDNYNFFKRNWCINWCILL